MAMALKFESGMARLPLTDEGNAHRFVARNSPSLRYCKSSGTWYTRIDDQWQAVGLGELAQRVIELVECMTKEIETLTDPREREDLTKWQAESLGHDRLKAIIRLAKSNPSLGISLEQLGLTKLPPRPKSDPAKREKRK